MKIKKFSKHNCVKQMKEHIKAMSELWLQADEVMEKKEDTKCGNQGGPVEIKDVGENLDADFGMKIRNNFLAELRRPMLLKLYSFNDSSVYSSLPLTFFIDEIQLKHFVSF